MTFDPDNPADPLCRGFHALETLNEENLGPKMELHPHARKEVEVITYVHEGTLTQQDGAGGMGRVGPGEFQHTRVHRGIPYRALNGSTIDPAHVFQCCITAKETGMGRVQEQNRFPSADREGVFRLIASPEGRDASLPIDQDVRLYSSILLLGHHLIHELNSGRGAWIHVVKGRIRLRDHDLRAGDGAALEREAAVSLTARELSEILLFDLA